MVKKYSSILFDIDNTLANTDPVIVASLIDCGCPRQGVKELALDDLHSISPPGLLQKFGLRHMSDRYWRFYKRNLEQMVSVFDPETETILQQIATKGVCLGIVTSGKKDIAEVILASCGIGHLFLKCLVSYGDCPRRKPHPDPIILAIKMLHSLPGNTIYIGDNEKDVTACETAGIDFGFAQWSNHINGECLLRKSSIKLKTVSDLVNYV